MRFLKKGLLFLSFTAAASVSLPAQDQMDPGMAISPHTSSVPFTPLDPLFLNSPIYQTDSLGKAPAETSTDQQKNKDIFGIVALTSAAALVGMGALARMRRKSRNKDTPRFE
jgi:hypothetical protein